MERCENTNKERKWIYVLICNSKYANNEFGKEERDKVKWNDLKSPILLKF